MSWALGVHCDGKLDIGGGRMVRCMFAIDFDLRLPLPEAVKILEGKGWHEIDGRHYCFEHKVDYVRDRARTRRRRQRQEAKT